MMTQLVLRQQGADVPYDVITAHFDIDNGAFDLVLELECADQDNEDAAPEIMIRLTRIKPDDDATTLHVRAHHDFAKNNYYDYPNAFVYSGFHHSRVTAWLKIQTQDDALVVADIRIVTDDVDHYDLNAIDNAIFGTCEFTRGKKSDMWGP